MQMNVVCEFGKLLRTVVTEVIKSLELFSYIIKKQDMMTRRKLDLCPQSKSSLLLFFARKENYNIV